MDERPKFFLKRKPVKCPHCSARKVVSIAYGLPSPELAEAAQAGRVVLGGCCLTDCDPSWECTACGAQIYHEDLKSRFLENQEVFNL
jgi:hypothetical protein